MARQTREQWFLDLSIDELSKLNRKWMAKNVIENIPKLDGYDDWLNYFRKVTPDMLTSLESTGKSVLPMEGYAAMTRWADIIRTPQRIDKIHQAGLTRKREDEQSITSLANSNNKLGVLYAIRSEIAEKLDKGTGARDTAALAKEMANIMDLISEAERRQGPGKDTKLAELMYKPAKRTRSKGARNTSYLSRTIKEVENG